MAVTAITATDATTVEVVFNQAPAADATITYTVGGVAYTPVMNGATATLTVATLVDDVATAVVVNDGAEDLFNGTVTYDINEITTITIQNVDFNKTIGSTFELTALVVDEDGDPIADTELKLEAVAEYDTNNLEPAVIQTATTNENGIASFSWTTAHDGSQNFEVYSVTRPVVRDSGTVVWTLSGQLVTLDASAATAESLSDESAFEFTVTALNADGSDYTGNLIFDLSVNGGTIGTNTTEDAAGNANIKGEVLVGATWTAGTDTAAPAAGALGESVAGQFIYNMQASDSGSKSFRIYTKDEGALNASDVNDITITAWYDKDSSSALSAQDPRVVSGKKSFVVGVPSITFSKNEAITTIATASHADDVIDYVTYELTVVDQFGNPYRGTVDISDYDNLDNNVTTVTAGAGFRFSFDTNKDGTFDKATSGSASEAFDFRIGQDDTDNDSAVTVKLVDATTGQTIEPTAYVDIANAAGSTADVADVLDANDVYVKDAEITSAARALNSLVVTPVEATTPAAGGMFVWKVASLDQFGSSFTTAASAADMSFNLLDADLAAVDGNSGSGANLYIDLDASTAGSAASMASETNTNATASGSAITLDDKTAGALPFYIAMDGGTGGSTYNVMMWLDDAAGTTNTYQAGEITETVSVSYAAQVLTSANISAIAATGTATVAANTDLTAAYSDHQTADGTVRVTYALKDQSSQGYTTTAAVNTTWTVTNNGDQDVTVNDGTAKTLAAGATATYTKASSVGANATATLDFVNTTADTNLSISVVADGIATADTATLYYEESVVTATSGTYNGTVVAFENAGADAGWIILSTPVGNIVVPHDLGTQTYVVEGNSTNEAGFEGVLSVGDVISVDASGANAAFNMTTNN